MAAGDIQTLRDRARAGDVAALTGLGKRLLTGDGVAAAPAEGVSFLREAAERGGPEATALVARFAGWGVLQPRNLSAALDRLQRAAELGWAPSQRELQFLARDPGTDWRALRQNFDAAGWIRAPSPRTVSDSPRICVIEGFASAAECEWLIERGRHGMRRAMVYRKDAPGHAEAESRTNTESDFTIWNADLVLSLFRDRIAESIRTETRFFEVTKLLRYEPGQRFSLHADFQEPETPALARELELRGQRVMTFLVYLNEDYEGGETEFPRAGFRYRGRRGDALYFVNADENGRPDHRTVHAGLPPSSGTKWLLSQWVRNRPVS
ncbi:MAG: 2OG-Fe(II) oxygenase [Steroidobacteraceae bacterium]